MMMMMMMMMGKSPPQEIQTFEIRVLLYHHMVKMFFGLAKLINGHAVLTVNRCLLLSATMFMIMMIMMMMMMGKPKRKQTTPTTTTTTTATTSNECKSFYIVKLKLRFHCQIVNHWRRMHYTFDGFRDIIMTATATATATTTVTTTIYSWNLTNETNVIENVTKQSLSPGLLLWLIINAVIFIFILGGNILTIVAVRTCRNLRSVISNLFILSLAVSDFMVGLALPYHLAFYLGSDLGSIRGFCLMRFFLFICACCVSMLTLISIAIDRYIAVVYALHYRRYMTRRMAYAIITGNWCFGAFIALLPVFWNNWTVARSCEFDEVLSSWYVAGVITPGFAIIWICMFIFYWRIMREASKQAIRLRQSVVYNTNTNASLLHPDWKSLQIVIFIMGSFTLCWLPYFIVAIAQLFRMCHSGSMIYKTAFSLAMTNSALNPIIYSWKNAGFRRAFAKILCCKSSRLCRVDVSDGLDHDEEVDQLPPDCKERIEEASSSKTSSTQ